jgi:hypothetical protein
MEGKRVSPPPLDSRALQLSVDPEIDWLEEIRLEGDLDWHWREVDRILSGGTGDRELSLCRSIIEAVVGLASRYYAERGRLPLADLASDFADQLRKKVGEAGGPRGGPSPAAGEAPDATRLVGLGGSCGRPTWANRGKLFIGAR